MAMLGAKCSNCCCIGPCPCTRARAYGTLNTSIVGDRVDPFPGIVLRMKAGDSEIGDGFKSQLKIDFGFECKGTKTEGPSLISVVFEPTCFGSGAAATATATGGDDTGPVSGVTLTSKGSGYAKLGREAPTFTLDNKNTTPATVSFTLTESEDGCQLPLWSIESISLTDGGDGYTDGQAIVVTASKGDTVVAAAKGTITTKGQHLEPTITASTTSGTGATLTVSLSKTEADPATWTISSISASGASQDYVDGESVNLSYGAAVVERAGAAVVVTQHIEPDLTLEVVSTEGGSGAQVSAVLASNGEDPEIWSVSDLSIDDAGTGYAVDEEISVVSTNGVEEAAFLGYVIGVGDDGEITQAIVFNPGGYYVDTDELKSIRVDDGGEYYDYLDNGEIESISVSDGGVYYRENPQLEPYVRTPTVTVQQSPTAAGAGAEITAVVDDDTSSPTFGKVTSLSLTDGGAGYKGFDWIYPGSFKVDYFDLQFADYDLSFDYTDADRCGCEKTITVVHRFPLRFPLFFTTDDGLWNDLADGSPISEVQPAFEFTECSQTKASATLGTVEALTQAGFIAEYEEGFLSEDDALFSQSPCFEEFLEAVASKAIWVEMEVNPCACGACCDGPGCMDNLSEEYCQSLGNTREWQGADTLCVDEEGNSICNPLP
jgi:hypothetical protein